MNTKIKELTICSMCLAILVICSKISINIGPIPITLQTFSVIIIGYILKWKKAVLLFLVYILFGLAGIPWFSGGGGYQYVLKPSFGFIIGFMLSALLTGFKGKDSMLNLSIKGLMGLLIIDVVGLIYMAFILNVYYKYNKSFVQILTIGLTPFIIKDIISVFICVIVYNRIKAVCTFKVPVETNYINVKETK